MDSTWNRVVYLSLISSFDQVNSMSNQMIIDKSEIDVEGNFSIQTDYLPPENKLYRLHITKKGDPPASLIIGGKDENHLFFIVGKNTELSIIAAGSESMFGNVEFINSPQSQLLSEVNKMLLYVDTTSFYNSPLKRELMENALDEKLRQFADTCSFPLVALFAIYKSNFENNLKENTLFFERFREKWKSEKSLYFQEFKEKIPHKSTRFSSSILFGIVGMIFGILITLFVLKRKSTPVNRLQELTLQERKIFALLQNEKTNKEISAELSISLSTVKSHVNNIFSKLNIKSRREIASL